MVIVLKAEINVKILKLLNGLPSVVMGDEKCNYCGHYTLATSIIWKLKQNTSFVFPPYTLGNSIDSVYF